MFGKTGYRVGGTRGGRDQFKWDDVKNDHYRENYLGHSLKAPVGRWQKGKDLTWWAKNPAERRAEAERQRKAELSAIKAQEEDFLRQAMGLEPKHEQPLAPLDQEDMKQALKRGNVERDEFEGERVAGLGAEPTPQIGTEADVAARKRKALERQSSALEGGSDEDDAGAGGGAGGGAGAGSRSRRRHDDSDSDSSSGSESRRKHRKKHKKDKKKHKKKEKKHRKKKHHKKHRKHDKRSRHDSESSSDEDEGSPRPHKRQR